MGKAESESEGLIMPPKKKQAGSNGNGVKDFRHDSARRKNNPPAGIAPTYEVRERQTTSYSYDPHLDPQLVWAGKAEHTSFDVDVVSLHIHERVSTRAILEAVRKPEPQLALFGETPLPADKQIEFYRHEVGWANRLVLGDSLLVMNSLLVKEGMAGKVQMIYMDPPYGIKYSSNFQPRIDRRDVKDKDEDLTHEPEQIKAYRDTWKLGIHSYLTYLRDRLLLSRELLSESGSIFVQINDENLHLVRALMDELFGRNSFINQIIFQKTGGLVQAFLPSTYDVLLWYGKDRSKTRFRSLYLNRELSTKDYPYVQLPEGQRRALTKEERANPNLIPSGSKLFVTTSLESANPRLDFGFEGKTYSQRWKTNLKGLNRLAQASRISSEGQTLRYVRFYDDFPVKELTNVWDDTMGERDMIFVVQTNTKVVERCILMTTDPGDLVFDPTCGSGTTAFCAEKWGRRWITCDTSRVALAIARQRLMTARFDYYELKDPGRGPAGGFNYETVPHITLESIAKNTEIDAIAAKYQPGIDEALKNLNKAAGQKWKEWEVPREVSDKWSREAKEAHERFWASKRKKRQEVDESIQRNAPQETLYDKPHVKRGVVRVSGPYTVEAIPVPAVEDPTNAPIPQFEEQEAGERVSDRGGDFLTDMISLLKQQGGILFPGGKKLDVQNLRPLNVGYLHAEGDFRQNGKIQRLAISFGPQHGPVTAFQVQEAIPTAKMNGYPVLIFAGFSFDPEAQALIQKAPVAGLQVHFANIAPDVLVGDLLKTTRASQIFTVFGQPDVRVEEQKDGNCRVELRGVDIYDPLTGEVQSTRGENVAAWFLDTDYDGKTFHICQAFFPGNPDAWEKLQRALKAQIDPEAFEKMRGITSFPFQPGEHRRIAVKVIDFRGNEVVRVVPVSGPKHHGRRGEK
jgi:adenine-specific DNA-methyltransferase